MNRFPTFTRWITAAGRPALLGVGILGLLATTPRDSTTEAWARPRQEEPQDPGSPYAIHQRTEEGLEPSSGATTVVENPQIGGVLASTSTMLGYRGLGGFAPGGNTPQPVPSEAGSPLGKVSLRALPAFAPKGKPKAMALVLANRRWTAVWIPAFDSRLSIVQEALDDAGRWRPIEFMATPKMTCGNSNHEVGLAPGQAWVFPAFRYSGSFKTRLRFRCLGSVGQLPEFSNEFEGSIDPRQFRPELLEIDWNWISVEGVRYEPPLPVSSFSIEIPRRIHKGHSLTQLLGQRPLVSLRVSPEGLVILQDPFSWPVELKPIVTEAARSWRFRPGQVNEVPISVSGEFPITVTAESPGQ